MGGRAVRLIVNADDLGLAPRVNRGIERAHRDGLLTSASLLATLPGFEDGVRVALRNPDLGIGAHLNVARGRALRPPARIRGLVDGEGRFRRGVGALWLAGSASRRLRAAVADERAAQLERIRAAGIRPTHLDAEKHALAAPAFRDLLARLADRYGIRARRTWREPLVLALRSGPRPDARALLDSAALRLCDALASDPATLRRPACFFGQLRIGRMTRAAWLGLLPSLPPGMHEVMVHPGEEDPAEAERLAPETGRSRFEADRPEELAALCDPDVRAAAAARGVRFITFGDLGYAAC